MKIDTIRVNTPVQIQKDGFEVNDGEKIVYKEKENGREYFEMFSRVVFIMFLAVVPFVLAFLFSSLLGLISNYSPAVEKSIEQFLPLIFILYVISYPFYLSRIFDNFLLPEQRYEGLYYIISEEKVSKVYSNSDIPVSSIDTKEIDNIRFQGNVVTFFSNNNRISIPLPDGEDVSEVQDFFYNL